MKRKLMSGLLTVVIATTAVVPAFAAEEQSSSVPLIGKIGRWDGNPTNPDDPNGGGGGGGPVDPTDPTNPVVPKPDNVTDINVTIPTAMTFSVVTNTTDKEPALASATYKIVNNGTDNLKLNVSSTVGDSNISFKDSDASVVAKKDGKIDLALKMSLRNQAGTGEEAYVKTGDLISNFNIVGTESYFINFEKPSTKAFSDVKIEQLNDTKTTTGSFVLKFTK